MKTTKIFATGTVFLLLAALVLPGLVRAYVGQGEGGSTRGYWRFNGDATDSSGQLPVGGNDGTVTGATYVTGKFGQALYFNRSASNYVSCGNSADFNITDMTIEAWIKTDSPNVDQPIAAKWRSNGNKYHYKLWVTGNRACFSVLNNAKSAVPISITGNTPLDTGWNHIAGTYDSTPAAERIRIFVNGKEDAMPVNVVMTNGATASELRIGADDDVTPTYFDGIIDEIRLLDFDRTAFSGGVVINEVYIDPGAGDNWIELYNNSSSAVNLGGWDFYNEDGALFTLNTDTTISAGQWLVLSESTPAYANLGNLDLADYLRVYDLDPDNDGANENAADYQSMVEYANWGAGTTVHADAVSAGLWTDATTVTVTGGHDTVHLIADGNNDEAVTDWESTATETPGEPVPDVNSIIFFGSGLALLAGGYLFIKKRRNHKRADHTAS